VRKESVVTFRKILFQNFLERPEEVHLKPWQALLVSRPRLDRGYPKHESGVLTTRLCRSVVRILLWGFREYCLVHAKYFWCKGIWAVNAMPTSRHQDCLLLFITLMVDRRAFLYRRQVMDLWAKKWREGSFVPRHSSVGGSVRQNSKNNLHIKIKIKKKTCNMKKIYQNGGFSCLKLLF
jgi:hypothetical protein